jgi:hypothetical protein
MEVLRVGTIGYGNDSEILEWCIQHLMNFQLLKNIHLIFETMDSDYKEAFDFVTRNGISIKVVKVERDQPHPYEAGELVDLYCVEVKRGAESFLKKWTLDDLDLDDEDYTYPALVYGVLHRIPLYFQESFEEYAMDCGSETEEQRRVAKIWYENDLELLANARRVFGDLYDEIETVFNS